MKKHGVLFLVIFVLAMVPACGGGGGGDNEPTAPVAPSGLSATVLSSSSIRLDWIDNSDNETGFIVMMGMGLSADSPTVTVGANVATYTINGLLPSTLYTFQIVVYNAVDDAACPVVSETTWAPPVAAPSGLQLFPRSSSEALIGWTDNSTDEDGFAIYRGTSPSSVNELVTINAINDNNYTDTGLSAGVTYYYEVRATKGAGESNPSNQESIVLHSPEGSWSYQALGIVTVSGCAYPLGTVLINPAGTATITEPSPRQIVITLASGTLGGSYQAIAFSPTVYQAILNGTVHGASVQSMILRFDESWMSGSVIPAGFIYYAGCQGIFNLFNLTRLPDVPDAPTSLSATTQSSSSIALSWTDTPDNEDGFKIYRGLDAGNINTVAGTVGAGMTTFTDEGLNSSTTYHYEVTAYNDDGESDRSNTDSAITDAPPATIPNDPSLLSASPISGSRIDLSWSDNSGNETHFYIYRGGSAGSLSYLTSVGANTNTYSDNSVSPGNTYFYQVKAYNSAGLSGGSNIDNAITPSVPVAPSNLSATPVSANEIHLTWTDNSTDETAFKVYQATPSCANSFNLLGSVNSPATAVSVIGLAGGTTYCYKIRATNAEGDSSYSNTSSTTTLTSTATLRIINDLDNRSGMDYYNSLIRVRIGSYLPVLNAECNSIGDQSTERLNRFNTVGDITQGNLIQAGYINPTSIHREDFDVSTFTSGWYCVWIQAGYWDYFIPQIGDPWWEIHPTVAYACDGVTETTKDAWFWMEDHTSGTFTVYASQFLPHYNWAGTSFCQ